MANGDTFEICTAVLGGAGGSVMVEISSLLISILTMRI